MPLRQISAEITSPSGTPREGYPVEFVDGEIVTAMTDAGGVFVTELDTEVEYIVGLMASCQIDGILYPAGQWFRLKAPEGDDIVAFGACILSSGVLNIPETLILLESLEEEISNHESRLSALEAM